MHQVPTSKSSGDIHFLLWIAIGFVFFVFAITMLVLFTLPTHFVPTCQEDELIVGIGDFNNGYWSEYVCIHPDTIING